MLSKVTNQSKPRELALDTQPRRTFIQRLKQPVVKLIGRERANRISAPYYDWLARRRTSKFLDLLQQADLCLNLGCGYRPLPGWVNLDMARGPAVDVVWDLSQGLPFQSESCSAIFSEHVIEHLPKSQGENLLRECYRVLQPGGVLRMSTPDAGRFLRSYAGDREFLRHPDFPSPVETPLDRINIMMREGGQHLWAYDFESLSFCMRKTGFSSVVEQRFGVSLHPRMQGIDYDIRAFESLYVEGVK
jgi:predicted SAM-dependent methyltransferase